MKIINFEVDLIQQLMCELKKASDEAGFFYIPKSFSCEKDQVYQNEPALILVMDEDSICLMTNAKSSWYQDGKIVFANGFHPSSEQKETMFGELELKVRIPLNWITRTLNQKSNFLKIKINDHSISYIA